MRYDIEINGRTRTVVVSRAAGAAGFSVTVDGRHFDVDATRIGPQTLSLIVGARRESHEVVVAPDTVAGRLDVRVDGIPVIATLNGRRRWGGDGAAGAADGPQPIVAPMPGKIVRVLVQTGEAVSARQPLVVMEAMKMENELRAVRGGTVAEIRAREGASVDAGALLVIVR